MQSVQQFKLRAIINITRYITLFSFVVFLVLNKLLFLKYVAFVFIIPVIFILFFIPRYLIFIKSFFKQKLSKNLFGEILKYEKWMIALAVVGAALSRVDIYMLSFLVNYAQLGIYSAAYNLISIVAFIPYSLGKVMFPKMSETPLKEVFGLTLRITKPILLMSVLLLLFIPIFHFIVPISFGHKYDGSIIIAQILLIATLISFVFLPVETSIYVIGKPKYVLLCRQIQLIILIVLNILTIPRFGMIWGAVNLVIARFVHGMILLYIFYREKEAYE